MPDGCPNCCLRSRWTGEWTTSAAFIKMIQAKFKSFLEKIITMDEFVVSMHTQETKMQLKRCLKKGTPDPTKAKVATSRTNQMALAFFNDRGVMKTNYIPPGPTVNGDYIIRALKNFLKALRLKRPDLVPGEWMFQKNRTMFWESSVTFGKKQDSAASPALLLT